MTYDHTHIYEIGSERSKSKDAYLLPSLDLCISVDSWDMSVSACIMRDECGLRDEQAPWCRSPLSIVGCLLRPGNMGCVCSEAGQWGEHDAVLQRYPPDTNGLEERRSLLCGGHGWCELEQRWESSLSSVMFTWKMIRSTCMVAYFIDSGQAITMPMVEKVICFKLKGICKVLTNVCCPRGCWSDD